MIIDGVGEFPVRARRIEPGPTSPNEAVATLQRALAVESRDPKLHLHLGTMLNDKKQIDEAAAAAERALALSPNDHDIINLMGRIAFEREDLGGALKPDLADAYNNMGNALKELGALAEAEAAFLSALARDRKLTGVYVNLADSRTFAPGDRELAAMEALAAIGRWRVYEAHLKPLLAELRTAATQ